MNIRTGLQVSQISQKRSSAIHPAKSNWSAREDDLEKYESGDAAVLGDMGGMGGREY